MYPHTRRTDLRFRSGLDLSLEAMIPGNSALERQVLNFFDQHRLEGEWFRPVAEIPAWFRQHRYFIDPGRPYYPNFTPHYELMGRLH